MSDRKEVELYKPAKLPSLGAPQGIQNKEVSDAIKIINNQIKLLNDKLRELEEAKSETFKYIRGSLNTGRTTPNSDGEIEIVSGNNSIEIKANENKVDMRVKNAFNVFSTTPPTLTVRGYVNVRVQNQGDYSIPLYDPITP